MEPVAVRDRVKLKVLEHGTLQVLFGTTAVSASLAIWLCVCEQSGVVRGVTMGRGRR
jgi:hypothetical protein